MLMDLHLPSLQPSGRAPPNALEPGLLVGSLLVAGQTAIGGQPGPILWSAAIVRDPQCCWRLREMYVEQPVWSDTDVLMASTTGTMMVVI